MPRSGSSSSRRRRQKQVQLSVFDNEPLARMAEQRLRQAGIPCATKSLHGGPGLWGSAYNLPHAIQVYEADEMAAREVLDLPPMEMEERERTPTASGRGLTVWMVLVVAVAVGAVVFVVYILPSRPGG